MTGSRRRPDRCSLARSRSGAAGWAAVARPADPPATGGPRSWPASGHSPHGVSFGSRPSQLASSSRGPRRASSRPISISGSSCSLTPAAHPLVAGSRWRCPANPFVRVRPFLRRRPPAARWLWRSSAWVRRGRFGPRREVPHRLRVLAGVERFVAGLIVGVLSRHRDRRPTARRFPASFVLYGPFSSRCALSLLGLGDAGHQTFVPAGRWTVGVDAQSRCRLGVHGTAEDRRADRTRAGGCPSRSPGRDRSHVADVL
jgi:hypothetical protein